MNCYSKWKIGENNPYFGRKHSLGTKLKMRKFAFKKTQLIDLYYNQKKSLEDIAKILKTNKHTIRSYMLYYSLKRRDRDMAKSIKVKGRVSPYKGKKHTKETRELQSIKKRELVKNGWKSWCYGKNKETDKRLEMAGKKVSETRKRLFKEGKLKVSQKTIESAKKRLLGSKLSEERKKLISLANKGINPWSKFKNPQMAKKRLSQAHIGKRKPWTKKYLLENQDKYWKNPEYIEKLRKSLNLHPNRPEKILIDLFEKKNLPYKYTGDFKFWIDGKNPDFVNCNGQKKVIEMFGDYWHNSNKKGIKYSSTEKGCKEHYNKYGFKTLIIWEKELKKIDIVLKKIQRFNDE